MTIQTERVKLDKAARELVEIEPLDSTVIPDEALLNAVKEQTGAASLEEAVKYDGELDLTNLEVKDLTGLEKLENLKGLVLTGTKVKEVNGKNLPKTLEKLNMSGCADLETIDLSAGGFANLKEADISGCEKLVLVYMNSVGLEKLDVSKDGKYEKVYAVDLSGNKLDFSKETPEGKFVNKVEENLKKNPPKALYKYNNVSTGKDITADEMAGRHEDPKVMVDGNKAQLSGGYYLDNKGTATINLGKVEDISKVAVTYKEKEFASEYKWEYSENGKDFKELVTVSDNEKPNAENVLDKAVKAQYLRYTTVNKGKGEAVILELEAFTKEEVESGVKYTGQSPLLTADYKDIPTEIQLAQGIDAVRIQDYMDKCYKEAKTVRGTAASALKDQKWLAEDYDIDAMTKVPEGMKVVITDADGNVYEDPFNPEKAGTYTAKFMSQDETVLATMTINVGEETEEKEGWVETENGWFYYENGQKVTGWKVVSEKWYYFNEEGIMQTGWVSVDGHWYYMDQWGAMCIGWVSVDNHWYYMDHNGIMKTGWVSVNNHWYYMDQWGAMQTGWVSVNGQWYYMNESGAMATGWVSVNGQWYYMDQWGAMQTGWVSVNGQWYYMNESGAMCTGWVLVGNDWYYMNTDGSMATSQWIGGYYVDASGKME